MSRLIAACRARGLYEPRPLAGVAYGLAVVAAIGASLALSPRAPLLCGVLLGVAWAHCGFLQHMGGHRAWGAHSLLLSTSSFSSFSSYSSLSTSHFSLYSSLSTSFFSSFSSYSSLSAFSSPPSSLSPFRLPPPLPPPPYPFPSPPPLRLTIISSPSFSPFPLPRPPPSRRLHFPSFSSSLSRSTSSSSALCVVLLS
ncbi:hypothetical protein AB1Y20_011920 [Prymnesium parvum]|uniref:PRA1 family protein n=1 Tax=Prymnesium parvum TaxID=97485 RepID=A0AB34IPQ0_PRYPA